MWLLLIQLLDLHSGYEWAELMLDAQRQFCGSCGDAFWTLQLVCNQSG